jgi:hypothetical protein
VSEFQGPRDFKVRSAGRLTVAWLIAATGLGAFGLAGVYHPPSSSVEWIEFSQSLLLGFLVAGLVTTICAIRFAVLARSVLVWLLALGGMTLFALLALGAVILAMMAGGGGSR